MLKFQQMVNSLYNYYDTLKNCQLFANFEQENISAILACLEAKVKKYQKEEAIFNEGDKAKFLGIVLSGEAEIIKYDIFGNKTILAKIQPSQIFGESFACADIEFVPINVIATKDCEIMFIDEKRIALSCGNACSFHYQLILNLLKAIAKKNILFNEKIEVTSKRSTREKLLTYLIIQAKKIGKRSFSIPYDRQGLADYLEVDRSGLSSEISKMRKEGIIESKRTFFTIL